MSLLEQASLVITPNAVKESKLYSVIPADGSGDMDVVRATTATRVNSDGLIEVVPYNLLTYSEQFNNAIWLKVSCSITANAATAPNGTLTADLIQATDADARCINVYNPQNILTHTRSIWAKTTSGTGQVHLLAYNSNSNSLFTITNEWQRFELTGYNLTGADNFYLVDFRGSSTLTELLIWGAQAEQGTSATEYFPTTTRLNIPRIDYTNGSCPSILVEPQRTNLFTYSEQFDNTAWIKSNATITSNAIASPNGTLTADLLVCNTTVIGTNFVRQYKSITDTTHTLSFYAKPNASSIVKISEAAYTGQELEFNLSSNTISGSGSQISGTITNSINGWKKITFTYIYTSGQTDCYININSTSLYIWGAQLEAGSNATSYIPTVSSISTRNQDMISKTGLTGITTITETFEDDTTNVTGGSPTSYTMSQGRIKYVIGI